MKNFTKVTGLIFIILICIVNSCKKEKSPTLSTTSVTSITATTAVSGGNITDDGGAGVIARGVCWGLNTNPTTSDSRTTDGDGVGKFESNLSGLISGSTYYIRAYATNSVGTAYGANVTFSTLEQSPSAITQAATSINTTSAILNGSVNGNSLSTSVTFEYGTTTSYGQIITATPGTVTGNSNINVTAELSGLKEGTTYHFRVKTVNSLGTTIGIDMSFSTLGGAPTAITQSACCMSSTGAILNGTVNANYLSATVTFEYGTTTAYGSSVTATQSPVTGNISTNVSANLSALDSGILYHFRIIAANSIGTTYGEDKTFSTSSVNPPPEGNIIADHTIVDRFDDIPEYYINEVKKMWLVIAGESHTYAYRAGLNLLETLVLAYSVSTLESGTPEAYSEQYLRASRATWGDVDNSSGWIYNFGEEDWFTSATAVSRTKDGIAYCNTHNLTIAGIGFGWCWDMVNGSPSSSTDPVYGCKWYGSSANGPDGNLPWGLDAADNSITGNSVNMDTYLNATQQYIDYCAVNGYSTKVFFTTGTVDLYYTAGEEGYQGYLKHEYIRNYVKADPTRILFDYADILCYDDNGAPATAIWNGQTFPIITATNLGDGTIGHISSSGSLRLAKAIWWMLARMAGWDGN